MLTHTITNNFVVSRFLFVLNMNTVKFDHVRIFVIDTCVDEPSSNNSQLPGNYFGN